MPSILTKAKKSLVVGLKPQSISIRTHGRNSATILPN